MRSRCCLSDTSAAILASSTAATRQHCTSRPCWLGSCSDEAAVPNQQIKDRVVATFCGMCGPNIGCGIKAIVKDGRFVGVEPLKESPVNKGRLCPVSYSAPNWVYSPNRLKYPLKRVGERGEGKFETHHLGRGADHHRRQAQGAESEVWS
jgi:anaerobic selenocysteine-containing dehydrogenase